MYGSRGLKTGRGRQSQDESRRDNCVELKREIDSRRQGFHSREKQGTVNAKGPSTCGGEGHPERGKHLIVALIRL